MPHGALLFGLKWVYNATEYILGIFENYVLMFQQRPERDARLNRLVILPPFGQLVIIFGIFINVMGCLSSLPVPSFYLYLFVSSCFCRTWQIGIPSPVGRTPFVWWSHGLKKNNGHLRHQPGDTSLCVQILLVVFNKLYLILPQKTSCLMMILSHHFLKLWMTKTRMRL